MAGSRGSSQRSRKAGRSTQPASRPAAKKAASKSSTAAPKTTKTDAPEPTIREDQVAVPHPTATEEQEVEIREPARLPAPLVNRRLVPAILEDDKSRRLVYVPIASWPAWQASGLVVGAPARPVFTLLSAFCVDVDPEWFDGEVLEGTPDLVEV